MLKLLSILVLVWLATANGFAQMQTIGVMSFNIRYDNPHDNENAWEMRKKDVVRMIAKYKPDLLGIQEGLHHQVEYILHHIPGYNYIGVGRDDGVAKGEFCALFYDSAKFELIFHKTFWLSETPDTISVNWDAVLQRICTYGQFKVKHGDDTLHVFNTHFDHVGVVARSMSAKLMLSKIKEYGPTNAHTIVMGDLNAIPSSEPVATFKQELDYGLEISIHEPEGPAGTFNAFDLNTELNESIDYIFTNQMEVLNYRHIDERRVGDLFLSDHLPVYSELKMIKSD